MAWTVRELSFMPMGLGPDIALWWASGVLTNGNVEKHFKIPDIEMPEYITIFNNLNSVLRDIPDNATDEELSGALLSIK